MQLIDTHAHLYLPQFDKDRLAMLERAFEHGIDKIFLPNIDRTSIDSMLALSESYPQNCFPMMGVHPCSIDKDFENELSIAEQYLFNNESYRFWGVGEIGLDYYWDKTYIEQQKKAYRIQIDWAKKRKLPIIIHSRDSLDDTIAIVEEMKDENLTGIFHCFTGSQEQARRIIDLDFMIGIGGGLTFKNANLGDVVKEIDPQYIVLETDAPYLTPAPFRGKRNESAYITYVAEKLATVYHMPVEQIAEATTKNALKIFDVGL